MFRTAAERETDCDDSLNDDDAGQHSILSFFQAPLFEMVQNEMKEGEREKKKCFQDFRVNLMKIMHPPWRIWHAIKNFFHNFQKAMNDAEVIGL